MASSSAIPLASASATTTTTTERLPPAVVELKTPPSLLAQRRQDLKNYKPLSLLNIVVLALATVPVWAILLFETLASAWKKRSLYAALAPPRDPDALAAQRAPWPFPVREFSVPVDGGRLRLGCVELVDPSPPLAAAAAPTDDDGDDNDNAKPLALFLSGFPELPYSWRNTMPVIAGKGYRCVALAMRGYHGSDCPPGAESYRLRRLADDVRDACDALTQGGNERKVLVVAHDWGGSVAWAAAALHSVQRGGPIDRMVIMALPPLALNGANLSWRQCLASLYILRFQAPWLPEAALLQDDAAVIGAVFTAPGIGCVSLEAEAEAREDDKAAASSAPASAAAAEASPAPAPPLRMSDADVAVYRHAFMQPGRATAALDYYRALMRWSCSRALAPLGLLSAYRDDDLYSALRTPLENVPVLLLHGDQDVALTTRLMDGWEAVCANGGSRAFLLGRCSHWVPQDRPRAVAELLGMWLPEAGGK